MMSSQQLQDNLTVLIAEKREAVKKCASELVNLRHSLRTLLDVQDTIDATTSVELLRKRKTMQQRKG